MTATLRAPFPWFGGKSRAAHLIWAAFGDVPNYVEPFAGSLAVLLSRPTPARIETVNDLDCYLANFWRAVKMAPEEVARHADWPVNEADLHARHRHLVAQKEFRERMHREPKYFDVEIAGWWVWGICQWIGGGWCAASNWDALVKRPRGTHTAEENRRPHLMGSAGVHVHRPAGDFTAEQPRRPELLRSGKGVVLARMRDLSSSEQWEKRPSLGKGGRGVHRTSEHHKMPELKSARGVAARGPSEQLPSISGDSGASGRGIHASARADGSILEWMLALSQRLRRVRVCCGDWRRVLGRSPTELIGVTGILFDPPYGEGAGRDPSLYAAESLTVAADVRQWCLENGANPKLKIALCGYEGEHEMPASWQCVAWKAVGGYAAAAGNSDNAKRERIWLSPRCARVDVSDPQRNLFESMEAANG